MSYQSQMHPFDIAKYKISDSSNKLYKYLLWTVVIAIIMVIVLVVSVVALASGFDFTDFDTNNLYSTIESLFAGGIVVIVLVSITGIALFIIMIMTYIQYYKLGSGFSLLQKSDSVSENAKNASFGIQGYLVAIIISIFVPDLAGAIISMVGNTALALGFYFVYRMFVDYQNQGRFNKKPTMILFIAATINLITAVASLFTTFGSIGSIIGFIMLVYGFRDLSKDIMQVQPPLGGPAKVQHIPSQTPSVSVTTQTETPPPTGALFCSNCGAKFQSGAKFCENCGSNL
ncbi:MAG: zinc ribbon domain-containing protein [Asgard group archaeon]|nr:zinc ribbon domain-containing protein [Asgard group archaeon]